MQKTKEDILITVNKVIAEQLGIDANQIGRGESFKDLCEPFDSIEVIMALEDEFDLEIVDEDADKFTTVESVADYLVKRIAAEA